MKESLIVSRIMDEARRLGWWTMKNHGNAFSVKGLPDLLLIKNGVACWIEVKRPGQHPTPIQSHRLRELAGHGCPVACVTSVAEAREFLLGVVG